MSLVEIMGLRHAGPAGWAAGGAWIVASVLSVVLLFRTVRRPGAPSRRLATITIACLGIQLVGCATLLIGARRRMMAIALGLEGPHYEFSSRWHGPQEMTTTTLFVAGAGLAFCASLLALTAIVSAVRAEGHLRGAPRRLALVLVVAGLAIVMGLAALRLSAASPPPWSGDVRRVVVAVAALGWIGGAVAAFRAGERSFGRGAASAAIALFVVGLTAFVATRGMAYDARHPIPDDPLGWFGCPTDFLAPSSLPVSAQGERLMDAPLLQLSPGSAQLVSLAKSPSELEDMLRRQRDVWLQIPRNTRPLPPLQIVAPALLGTEEIATWLRAIEEHLGQGFVIVAVQPTRHYATRTLGELPATPHCGGIPVRLDPAGPALTSYPTWGDLARAHAAGSAPLGIRLR